MLDILLDGYVRFSHCDSSTIIVVYDYVTYYYLLPWCLHKSPCFALFSFTLCNCV